MECRRPSLSEFGLVPSLIPRQSVAPYRKAPDISNTTIARCQ
jgi:hypothetical protein